MNPSLPRGMALKIPTERLLRPSEIPTNLWSASKNILYLPDSLATAYIAAIDQLGLRELGSQRDDDPPIGGLTEEDTRKHFAQAFDGSCARTLLAILDPKGEAGASSDAFLALTAGGHLCLTDVPCGAGAASISMLCALADLRKEGVLPRTPLRVEMIAGEISEHARGIASSLLQAVNDSLREQAIFVSSDFVRWDVTCAISNAELTRKAIRIGNENTRRLVVVANFSGFLVNSGKMKIAEPQIEELFRFQSGANTLGIWIEPQTNKATRQGGVFSWLSSKLKSTWGRFFKTVGHPLGSPGEQPEHYTSDAKFQMPLVAPRTAYVRLAVSTYQLTTTVD